LSQLIQTRAEFQALAETRLLEAKALLDLGMWDGAYYMAGYAVELAFKACIIKMLRARDAFPDRDFSRDCYTHGLKKLVAVADLTTAHAAALASDPVLKQYWSRVEEWSEQTRYHRVLQTEAEELYEAIADISHGVFSWIKVYW
jgi:HEPN domain-containing protein